MELIPQEIKELIPKLYETEEQNDPIAYVKLFLDAWTWYITELSIDNNICFGYVISPFESNLSIKDSLVKSILLALKNREIS